MSESIDNKCVDNSNDSNVSSNILLSQYFIIESASSEKGSRSIAPARQIKL